MIDGHIHCIHSADGVEDPRTVIEKAISLGMEYIAFTDHLDADNKYCIRDLSGIPDLDIANHKTQILELKKEYSSQIFVGLGIEFGYIAEAQEEYRNIAKMPFDVIINSVHLIEKDDCYDMAFYDNRTKDEAYKAYLDAVLESIYAQYDYDIIGHIGYIARKAPFEQTPIEYNQFKTQYDNIIAAIIEKDKSLEINSHSKNTQSDFLPWLEIIKRYKELGGKKISFGSDAHRIERLAEKYDICCEAVKSVGFKEWTIYKNRTPYQIKI